MVRRGSTVRVRRRALRKPRTSGLSRLRSIASRPVCPGMEQILEHRGEKGRRLVVFLDNVSATSDLAERGSTCRADGSELRPGLAQCAALEQPRKAACPSGLTAAPLSVLRLPRLDIGEAARSFEQHLDELGLLVAQEAPEFGTVDRGRHLYGSFIKSAKTVRPTLIASGIEIGKPLSSGCLRR
jgi:hypothetical protein